MINRLTYIFALVAIAVGGLVWMTSRPTTQTASCPADTPIDYDGPEPRRDANQGC